MFMLKVRNFGSQTGLMKMVEIVCLIGIFINNGIRHQNIIDSAALRSCVTW